MLCFKLYRRKSSKHPGLTRVLFCQISRKYVILKSTRVGPAQLIGEGQPLFMSQVNHLENHSLQSLKNVAAMIF